MASAAAARCVCVCGGDGVSFCSVACVLLLLAEGNRQHVQLATHQYHGIRARWLCGLSASCCSARVSMTAAAAACCIPRSQVQLQASVDRSFLQATNQQYIYCVSRRRRDQHAASPPGCPHVKHAGVESDQMGRCRALSPALIELSCFRAIERHRVPLHHVLPSPRAVAIRVACGAVDGQLLTRGVALDE